MKQFASAGFCLLIGVLLAPLEHPVVEGAEKVRSNDIKILRKKAAKRKRRLVVHSDGYPMNPKHRGLFEPHAPPSLFPQLAGTQTDACTYSLVHQFPVARLYRSKAAQQWPPGIIRKLYGDGPDGLNAYIDLCRKNNFEAFWAMRMNDTHDASGGPHGRMRWNSNRWKQTHPEYLVGKRDTPMPYGQWSALDYARPEVREKVFRVLEEVCRNYEIDGLVLDFFRHLPTFKTTVMGGHATTKEVQMLNDLFGRIRRMADEIGARRGRPILLAVRTPDSLDYSKALGLDVEHWMKEDLIDIWIATGYFRLQEWAQTVAIGHKHGVQVWASIDESRITGREDRNSLEIYRGRIMNAWNAGVDAIWLFNFFYQPKDPQFKLLREAGDPNSLALKDTVYVAEARGQSGAGRYLKYGNRFFTRPRTFSPAQPATLKRGETQTVRLFVGDEFAKAAAKGYIAKVTLRIRASPGSGRRDLDVRFNEQVLQNERHVGQWVDYELRAASVKKGVNQIVISRGPEAKRDPVLHDLQLAIRYHPSNGARSNKAKGAGAAGKRPAEFAVKFDRRVGQSTAP